MNKPLTFDTAVNNLSFGFVGFNIIKELYRREYPVNILAKGGSLDFSSFDKASDELKNKIRSNAQNFFSSFNRNNPTLQTWHINGSESHVGAKNNLLTFFELDQLTPSETNILNNHHQIFVTNEEARQTFLDYGVERPVYNIPLGFDKDQFFATGKKYLSNDTTVWAINGKFEKRKKTLETARLWLKKYGNNRNHRLHLHVYNPFFSKEQNQQLLAQIFENKEYWNVSSFHYTTTLSELNDAYNCANIVIDMSGGEGWSLPSFHMTGLGKHAIVLNSTGIKEWAIEDNAVLVQPNGKEDAEDKVFFHKGQLFNQGNFYTFDSNEFSDKLDIVLKRSLASRVNSAGLEIQNKFTWQNTVDQLLAHIS